MDAVIEAGAMGLGMQMSEAVNLITPSVRFISKAIKLVELVAPALVLRLLALGGHSLSAVAPDYNTLTGGMTALAYA